MIHVSIVHYIKDACSTECPSLSSDDLAGIKEIIRDAMKESLHGAAMKLRFDYDERRSPAESDTCIVIEVCSDLNQLHERKICEGVGTNTQARIADLLPDHELVLLVIPQRQLNFR